MKGSDQICSLDADNFKFMVDSINNLQIAKGNDRPPVELPKYLLPIKEKMRKTKREDGVYRI